MKLTKLGLAMASLLGAGVAADALALDLYVDTKTQQIFAEPGHGRVKLGTFQQVDEHAANSSTKSELEAQKAEIAKIKDDLALKTNELKAVDEHLNDPSHGVVHIDEKGVKFESKDGNFEMAINGRMQVDSQMNVAGQDGVAGQGGYPNPQVGAPGTSTTNQLADGTSLRRARLGVEGTFYKTFEYKFEYDFTRGNGSTAGGVTDAYINWKGYDPLGVKLGQFKEPFSLEEATSNRWLTFIERNMSVNAFSDNNNAYKIGAALTYAQPRWTAAGAIQTESVGNGTPTNNTTSQNINGNANRNGGSGDTGWELTGRLTGLPWFEDKTKFVHVGVSGSERQINNNYTNAGLVASTNNSAGMSFNSQINTNVDRQAILNTGNLTNGTAATGRRVDRVTRFGGEGAAVYGPFSAQAEYIQADISGQGYNGESLNGYYGYVSYFLTGESRNYKAKTGAWDRIKPNRNFSTHGGWGAWETAIGYDYLNLESGVIKGGKASTGKIGLNWYPNSHVKFMLNFIHFLNVDTHDVNVGNVATPTTDANSLRSRAFNSANMDIFEVRGQVDF